MSELNRKTLRLYSMLGQRGTCGYTLTQLAEQYPNLLCMTADLCNTSGLDRFAAAYPNRMLNAGIAEQNMIGVAAGLAMDGYQVFASTFATFATMRSIEQLRTMLAYMNLNVKLIGMASGFSMGFFGNSHYSMEDLAMTRAIPNLTVLSPADGAEVSKAVEAAAAMQGPLYLRLTGGANMPMVYRDDYKFTIGKAVKLRSGSHLAFAASGSMVYQALKAAEILEQQNISCSVYNFHTIKPIDREAIDEMSTNHRMLVSVEEHNVLGGLGSAIAEQLIEKKSHAPLKIIGIRDYFPKVGSYPYMLEQCGLTGKQIADSARQALTELNLL